MALGHTMMGMGAGLLAVLTLTIAGQPLWQVALAYSLVGSLTVVTCALLELKRMRPTVDGRPGWPVHLPPARVHR